MCLYPKLNSPYLSVAAEVQKDAVKLVITGTFAQLTVVTVSQLAMLGGFAVLSCRLAESVLEHTERAQNSNYINRRWDFSLLSELHMQM